MSEDNAYGACVDENGASVRNNVKVERLLALIEEHRGNISAIARSEGEKRSTVKEYIDKTPELVQALSDWRQGIIDKSEDNIFLAVEKGDLASSKMVAATLGKDRGWVPREEQTGKDGKDLIPSQIIFTTYEDEENETPDAAPSEVP